MRPTLPSLAPWQRTFAFTLLPVFAAFFYVLIAPTTFNDGDTNWHVATGLWILDHHGVPATDPFSFAAVGRPWVTHEWLSEALTAGAYRLAGWSGVRVLTAVFTAASAGLLAYWLQARLPTIAFVVVIGFCFYVLLFHILARPHIIALPFLILWTIELIGASESKKTPPLWLLPMMTLWANLHGSYIFGLAFAGVFAIEAVLGAPGTRLRTAVRWGLFIVAAALAALITPNGFDGLVYPIKVMSMGHLQSISEWRPITFVGVTPFAVTFFVMLAGCLYLGVKLPLVRLGLFLLLLEMTLQHIRQEMIFAVIAPFLLAEPIAAALNASRAKLAKVEWPPLKELAAPACVIALVLIGAAGWTLATPETRVDQMTTPVTALEHVPASLRSKPVFNNYGFGGWLIFNHVRPFIDGRSDMYGDDHLKRYLDLDRSDPIDLDKTFDRYGIVWSILPPNDGLVAVLRTKGWRTLYADKWAVVQVDPRVDVAAPPSNSKPHTS